MTLVTVFWPELGIRRYHNATEVNETFLGGLEFIDNEGDSFTISHQIPWCTVEFSKERQ